MFPDVTILFSDVVKFNEICIHITPMQVVDMLNEIYIVFDTLSEKHNVYKVGPAGARLQPRPRPHLTSMLDSAQVETIRDAYMVVAGVPNKTTFHAHHICDMALDMLSSIDHLKDPSTGDNIQIRVGEDRPGGRFQIFLEVAAMTRRVHQGSLLASPSRDPLGDGGGRRGGPEDASLLSVRGHRQHSVTDGEQWSGVYTYIYRHA